MKRWSYELDRGTNNESGTRSNTLRRDCVMLIVNLSARKSPTVINHYRENNADVASRMNIS